MGPNANDAALCQLYGHDYFREFLYLVEGGKKNFRPVMFCEKASGKIRKIFQKRTTFSHHRVWKLRFKKTFFYSTET